MKKIKTITILTLTLGLTLAGCEKDKCEERPKKNCYCTYHLDPVCGCNGKTYGNSCEAECNRITEYTKGACK